MDSHHFTECLGVQGHGRVAITVHLKKAFLVVKYISIKISHLLSTIIETKMVPFASLVAMMFLMCMAILNDPLFFIMSVNQCSV